MQVAACCGQRPSGSEAAAAVAAAVNDRVTAQALPPHGGNDIAEALQHFTAASFFSGA